MAEFLVEEREKKKRMWKAFEQMSEVWLSLFLSILYTKSFYV